MQTSQTQVASNASRQRPIRWSAIAAKVAVYSLLVTGAAVFSFPFLWMAATSVKVDRELQTRDLKILPLTPHARQRSPYIDTTYYDDIEGPHQEQLLPALEEIAEQSGFEIPAVVNRQIAEQQIARGLYGQLRARLPAKLWQSTADDAAERLIAAAREEAPSSDDEDVVVAAAAALAEEPSSDDEDMVVSVNRAFDLERRVPSDLRMWSDVERDGGGEIVARHYLLHQASILPRPIYRAFKRRMHRRGVTVRAVREGYRLRLTTSKMQRFRSVL